MVSTDIITLASAIIASVMASGIIILMYKTAQISKKQFIIGIITSSSLEIAVLLYILLPILSKI